MAIGQVIPFREGTVRMRAGMDAAEKSLIVTMYPSIFASLGAHADIVGTPRLAFEMIDTRSYQNIFADMGPLGGPGENGFRFARIVYERTDTPLWLMTDKNWLSGSNKEYAKRNHARGLVLRSPEAVLAIIDADAESEDAESQEPVRRRPAAITKEELARIIFELRKFIGPIADDEVGRELGKLVLRGHGSFENVAKVSAKNIDDPKRRARFLAALGIEV